YLPDFYFLLCRPPCSTLFPYTTLFRSEGKTFLTSSLAYAFALISKKVLLIGDNYPNLTELISNRQQKENQAFESFLVKKEIKTEDRKSTRLNSSHVKISYAVFCLKKKK